ncbi:Uncharacterised protein [Legionella steigerwaltii]|uniref:Uncharacterized protein n=1 Tax=Legionella steigerwaltii TaxID=460 RepID=A0A378L7Z8_9GAMM|nr:hypothetical protein [Legionella steigerwaltii]KTD77527.1 hypothetical protein Lstg_1884 [Legionella steigerwaltii]STY22837.1 Uncharacterised protein [Legionella steigerwaltii]
MPSLYFKLEPKLQNIIDKYKIDIINDCGEYNRGADMVFFFLQPGADRSEIVCAIKNIMNDSRFVQIGTKSGRNAAGDALIAYAINRHMQLLEEKIEEETVNRSSAHHIKQKIEATPLKFFSKSNGMEVSEEYLTDENMAATFAHNKKGM